MTTSRRTNYNVRSLIQFVIAGIFFSYFVLVTRNRRLRLKVVKSYRAYRALGEAMGCPPVNWTDPRLCFYPSGDQGTVEIGESFGLDADYLSSIGIPIENNFTQLGSPSAALDDFVFVTGANEGYFHVVMDAIGNVQRLFPTRTIYFYDLEPSRNPNQTAKIEQLCGVKHRIFNYSLYPAHVRHLKLYAFKPLIVHEMLREFPGVFWIDSSVRFQTSNITSALEQAHSNDGILAFARSHHSNFAVIHPGMFRYLPISASAAGFTEQRDANSILFYRTEEVYTRIVVWWVLCALKEDCMAAGRQLYCGFRGKYDWAGCHRFDQSAINILMARQFDYDDQKYLSRETVLLVQRGHAHQEQLEVCPSRNKTTSALYFVPENA